jgi:formylglycine-generating enzyme required for sulfatase activity
MKTTILFILLISIFGELLCQSPLKLNGKKTNFVTLGETTIYANKFEVTNKDYSEFLKWILINKSEQEYKKHLPDTTVWINSLSSLDVMLRYYFRHPAFQNYPVVGISYDQAKNYCLWLTEKENKEMNDKNIKKIIYRLPIEEEWEIAAHGGFPEGTIYPWGYKTLRANKGKLKGSYLANFMHGIGDYFGGAGALNDSYATDVVDSYQPNGYGLFNISGNVAEMVEENTICKGGGWISNGHKLVISSRDTMKIAEMWVGFRVFAEIEEFQINHSPILVNAKFIEKNVKRFPAGGYIANGYGNLFNDTVDIFVQQSFHISAFEVSNKLYHSFIHSLKDSTLKNKYIPEDKNWKHETSLIQYQHYSSQFSNYTVVNITREAMIAFCEWMTNCYNSDSKRAFQKVRFSLPTVKQQIVASQCGSTSSNYSWGGPYHVNSKGEYLMNYNPLLDFSTYNEKKLLIDLNYRKNQLNTLKKSRALDGFEFTAPVDSYFPCSNGLYNLNGNVAEAVLNSDYVFGGSFASMLENCRNLGSEYAFLEKINLPSPQVGFRFVMEIIEE